MADIKLFVCCHQPFSVPNHPLLVPVQVGSALADSYFAGFVHDDTGENISVKNRSYCELTAQYWAWKNADADYYGFFHYRRYLYPREHADRPYCIRRKASLQTLNRMGYCGFEEIIKQYDLIAPIGENMHISVRDHYASSPFHHKKDLDLIEQIVSEQCPYMVAEMDTYLSGTVCYFGNIYIMAKSVFDDYCQWLFSVLEEFDRRADLSGYSSQECRVDGYLAERLFGIYLEYHRSDYRIAYLPRVHFQNGQDGVKRRLLNILMPPGSKVRSTAKKLRGYIK